MELTGLCEESKEVLKIMIAEYRKIQKEILSGFILPIGQEPNGTTWTGFQSIQSDNRGYIIIFRELASSSAGTVQLWNQKNKKLSLIPVMKMEETNKIIAGKELESKEKPIQPDEMGYCKFTLKNPFSFAVYRYE